MIQAVVPYAFPGDRDRQRALVYVQRWLAEHHQWRRPVIGAIRPGEEWSKGVAVARAVRRVRADVEVVVIHDADVLTAPDVLDRCVAEVRAGAPWATPHQSVFRLSEFATALLYEGRWPTLELIGPVTARHLQYRRPQIAPRGGGIVVLSREVYEDVGGIDPRFVGWGGEDISFGRCLDTLAGEGSHHTAALWHLYHERQERRPGNRGSAANEQLAGRYLDATGDPVLMRALVAQHRVAA